MEAKTFYANRVVITSSLFDVQMKLFTKMPITNETNTGLIEITGEETIDEITVCMSPIHAKTLYSALGAQLAQYESAFGEMKLPEPEKSHIGE